jgi:2-(1,2-epoxy-1,2-dihydrophenyl)acetyl-CoA isomerase
MDPSVQLDISGGVARFVLSRPASGNAITMEMGNALLDAALRCEGDATVKVVVLTGAGKAFCLGGDLQGMVGAGDGVSRYLNELTTVLHSAITCFTRMNALVIAAVNGTAAGAGLGLVAMADLAVAAASAKFTSAYTALALTPDAGVSFLLPRAIGRKRAMDMLINNRVLSAEQAVEWGLVNEVFPDDKFESAVQQRAEDLAARPTAAFAAVKALLASADPGLESQLAAEGRSIARAGGGAEGREAIRNFLSRRQAPTRF